MPCGDYSFDDTIQEQSQRILALTRIACDLKEHLEHGSFLSLQKETRDWIDDHEKRDRERQRRERADENARLVRKKALKKLTPEERRLLGV